MVLCNSSKEILPLSNLFTDHHPPFTIHLNNRSLTLSSLIVKNSPKHCQRWKIRIAKYVRLDDKFGRSRSHDSLRISTLWPSKFLLEIHNGRGNNGSLLLLPLSIVSSPLLASPRLPVIYALRGTNSRWKDARTRCRHVQRSWPNIIVLRYLLLVSFLLRAFCFCCILSLAFFLLIEGLFT